MENGKTVSLIQTNRELYSADFSIRSDDKEIGQVHIDQKFYEFEKRIRITYLNESFELIKGTNRAGAKRLYQILKNGNKVGEIYRVQEKTSLLDILNYRKLLLNNKEYTYYTIGFGEDGIKCPLLKEDVQVAQVNRKAEIIDDLHEYTIISKDDESILPALLLAVYDYSLIYLKQDMMYTKGVRKEYIKTENEIKLSKFNRDFEKEYGNQ